MSKTTLVLGHSHYMDKDYDIRCSPIDVSEWINDPFVCVDYCSDDCDIEYNLLHSQEYLKERDKNGRAVKGKKHEGYWNWAFAEDASYDRIIDTMGKINWIEHSRFEISHYRHEDALLKTIRRVLNPGGKFYSYMGIYTLDEDTNELVLEKKELYGYRYKSA